MAGEQEAGYSNEPGTQQLGRLAVGPGARKTGSIRNARLTPRRPTGSRTGPSWSAPGRYPRLPADSPVCPAVRGVRPSRKPRCLVRRPVRVSCVSSLDASVAGVLSRHLGTVRTARLWRRGLLGRWWWQGHLLPCFGTRLGPSGLARLRLLLVQPPAQRVGRLTGLLHRLGG